MSDRLTDQQVAFHAASRRVDAAALAREVQEWRSRRCDGCELYEPEDPCCGIGFCSEFFADVDANFACNAWTPKVGQ